MSRSGIDVADWQHPGDAPIDWNRVRQAGISWCCVKLTEGLHYVNPWAHRDVTGAKAAGLEVGVYHFARPTESNPADQRAFFLGELYKLGGCDFAALDLEDGRQLGWPSLARWVTGFLANGGAQLVYYPLGYQSGVRPYLDHNTYREWVAAPQLRSLPPGASVWQNGQAAIPGVPGRVDVDVVAYDRPGTPVVAMAAGPPTVAHLPAAKRTLHRGDRGDDVKYLQAELNNNGAHLATDGDFGDSTRAAVMTFQRSRRLVVDGWVGPRTWAALGA